MKTTTKVLLAGSSAIGLAFAVPAVAQVTIGGQTVDCAAGVDCPIGTLNTNGEDIDLNGGGIVDTAPDGAGGTLAVLVADDLEVEGDLTLVAPPGGTAGNLVVGGTTTTNGLTNTGTFSTTGNTTLASTAGSTLTLGNATGTTTLAGATTTTGLLNANGGIDTNGGTIVTDGGAINAGTGAITGGAITGTTGSFSNGLSLTGGNINAGAGNITTTGTMAAGNTTVTGTLTSTGNTTLGTGAGSVNTIGNATGTTTINGTTTTAGLLNANGGIDTNGAAIVTENGAINTGSGNITTTGTVAAGTVNATNATVTNLTVTGTATLPIDLVFTGQTSGITNTGNITTDTLTVGGVGGAGAGAIVVGNGITATPTAGAAAEITRTGGTGFGITQAALGTGLTIDANTQRISGLANGTVSATSSEAVTGAQLFATNNAVRGLQTGLDTLTARVNSNFELLSDRADKAYQGVAMGFASSAAPLNLANGEGGISGGVGYFQGEWAGAVKAQYVTDAGVGLGVNLGFSQDAVGGGVGASIKF